MGKPGSSVSKLTISGTRGDDSISVGYGGYWINGSFKSVAQSKIEAGLIIKGGDGNDFIGGGPGSDTLDGGNGNDILRDDITTVFIGGAGIDTADLSGSSVGVALDLQGSGTVFTDSHVYDPGSGYLEAELGGMLTGTLQGIENVIGTLGNDFIKGSSTANVLRGGAGDDIISAISMNDFSLDKLFGDDGNDNLFAGSGNDELTGGAGADIFSFDPRSQNGNWVISDFSLVEGDRARLFPYDGNITWDSVNYQGVQSVRATFDGGDTLTFVGISDYAQVDLLGTMAWPGP